jgi:hypothetical protein
MADDNNSYDIKADLVRNVITEPLYSNILDNPTAPVNIIIDVNLQYLGGRENAFLDVIEIAKAALAAKNITDLSGLQIPESIGSSANPFMSGCCPVSSCRRWYAETASKLGSKW